MKKIVVKKIWNSLVSVRDYELEEAIKNGESVIIEYRGETMFVPRDKINDVAIKTGTKIKSKWGSQDYELIDLEWKPNTLSLF